MVPILGVMVPILGVMVPILGVMVPILGDFCHIQRKHLTDKAFPC
jgi:hypothetical protein